MDITDSDSARTIADSDVPVTVADREARAGIAVATPPAAPAPYIPPPAAIDEANELLNTLQRILMRMGTDERRNSDQFHDIKEQYKLLGTELHQVRKLVAVQRPAAARPATLAPRPGISLIDRARQATGLPYIRPVPRRPAAAAEQAPTTAPEQPTAPPRGTAGGIVAPAAGSPVAEVGAHGRAPVLAPAPITDRLPIGFPISIPKFACVLGPAGHPGATTKGDEVSRLQQVLAKLGYDCPPTGIYDVKTFRGVKSCQEINGIPANGLVGANMRRFLNQLVTE